MSMAWQTWETKQNPELDPRVRGLWQCSWTTYNINFATLKQLPAPSCYLLLSEMITGIYWAWNTTCFRVPILVGLWSCFEEVSFPQMWFLWFPRLPGAPCTCVCVYVHAHTHVSVCVFAHTRCVSVTLQGAFPHLNSQLKPTLALNACHCF